jgi:hypothetical protein
MATRVTVTGPLFDGRVERAIVEAANDAAGKLGTEGERRWKANLDGSLRRPSGAYMSRITPYGPVGGQHRTHDRNGVYGPWLEGTGSRNATTRFKGYASARRATQELERGAAHLVEEVVRQHLERLG